MNNANAPEQQMTFAYYLVTVTPQVESWNCTEYTARVYARDRNEAIKMARAEYKENHQSMGQHAATYRATKDADQSRPVEIAGIDW